LDGRLVASAPIVELEVPPGTIELMVVKDGMKEWRQSLTVTAGTDYSIQATLLNRRDVPMASSLTPADSSAPMQVADTGPVVPLYSRPIFWVGVGVVVAAAAVTSVVLISNNQTYQYTDKEICGPNGCDGCIGFTCAASAIGRSSAGILQF
jgi:hypothetical protein